MDLRNLNKKTFVGKVAAKDYDVVVLSSTINGEPYVHTLLIGKEKITGGEIVNIFTSEKTEKVFTISLLKDAVFSLLYEIAGKDYRDLNFNIYTDFSSLPEDYFKIISDYNDKYQEKNLIPIMYSFVIKNINDKFTFDYNVNKDLYSNDLKVSFTSIDPTVYTSKEDLDNINYNKSIVAGTTLPDCAKSTLEAFKRGTHNCALFYGEASTGKSFAARIIAAELGIPVYSYNFAAGSDESFVQGKYAPKEDEPGFTFLKNNFIKAYSEGGLFVAEELNYAFANVTGPLNSALDFLKKITLANEKQIDMHPNFRMITTINPCYEGTQPLNRALLSRQEIVVRFENITPKEVSERLKNRFGYENIPFAIKIGEFINKLNKTLYNQAIDGYVSLREIESCLKLAQYIPLVDAIKDSIINKVTLNETKEVYDAIMSIIEPDLKELSELYSIGSSDSLDYFDINVSNVNDEDLTELFSSVYDAIKGDNTKEDE